MPNLYYTILIIVLQTRMYVYIQSKYESKIEKEAET